MSPIVLNLAGVNLSSINSSTSTGYLPCTIPGYSALLYLEIEEAQKSEFISRLRRQLIKVLERRKQFNIKAEKYERIIQRDQELGQVKPNVIEKNSRKRNQARAVAESAGNEAQRLQELLCRIYGEKNMENTNNGLNDFKVIR